MPKNTDTQGIKRFLAAVGDNKRPLIADCRAAAALIQQYEPFRTPHPWLTTTEPTRGRPADPAGRDVARRVLQAAGDAEPREEHFRKVGADCGLSAKAVRGKWNRWRDDPLLVPPRTIVDLVNDQLSALETFEATERSIQEEYETEIQELRSAGLELYFKSWADFRPVLEEVRETPFAKREDLFREFRRILDGRTRKKR